MSEIPEKNRLKTLEREILERKGQITGSILEIGDRLIEAKEMLAHGAFLPWLQNNVGFSERTARNFMQAARAFPVGKRKAISDLTGTSIIIISQQSSERQKELLDNPEISKLSTRELKALIKSRPNNKPDMNILTQPIFTPEMKKFGEKVLSSGDISLIKKWRDFLLELAQGIGEICIDLEVRMGELMSIQSGADPN